jgi:hypothetical protein
MNNLIGVFMSFLIFFVGPTYARSPHVINFRSSNLYPESLAWDPTAQHFLVGSLRYPKIVSVSDAAVVDTFIFDESLPPESVFLGVTVDSHLGRLLAVVHSNSEIPPYNGLAAYDLRSGNRLFLAPLIDPASTNHAAGTNDVAVDFSGNAFVTNSASNFVWKVNSKGEGSVFSNSSVFSSHPVDPTTPFNSCGLNGIAYNSKGYLLVVQSNTGKLFKVDAEDGTARTVLLNKDLAAADGITVRSDGVVVAVSQHKAYYIKSDSSWSEGVVYDETALDADRFASSATVGGEDRVYVLYGHVKEGVMGIANRELFRIAEIDSRSESGEENLWVYVLIAFALAYFFFWRFQMKQLVTNMNKKIA